MKCTSILVTCITHSTMAGPGTIKSQPIPDTIGLVVCGGQSSRMGTDKSMLRYHEKPQRYHMYKMLQPLCEKVFISCRHSQADTVKAGYRVLVDDHAFKDSGPMAALLTAFRRFPKKNILFTGCDYPFLTQVDLEQFSVYCKGDTAACFYNEEASVFEPLLAWYPAQSWNVLRNMQKAGEYSLQHFLKTSGAVKFQPGNKKSMTSVDTHKDFIEISTRLFRERLTFF